MQLLDNEATYLGQLGEGVTDVQLALGALPSQQADNSLDAAGRPGPRVCNRRIRGDPRELVAQLLACLCDINRRPRRNGTARTRLVYSVATTATVVLGRAPSSLPEMLARSVPSSLIPVRLQRTTSPQPGDTGSTHC